MTLALRTPARSVADAVAAARAHAPTAGRLPVHERARVLRSAAALVAERRDELARLVTTSTGKVLKDTRREVDRVAWTLQLSAAAGEELAGTVLPGDRIAAGTGSVAITLRQPVGLVGAITPFNAPLNLVAHKVGPAVAAGNACVLKPSPRCTETGLALVDLLEDAGLPRGVVTVAEGGPEAALQLAGHPEVDLVSFTGGPTAGEAVRRAATQTRVVLELGGNSANIVHHDADVDQAVAALVRGGFGNQGQSCNSVQRLLVHRRIVNELIAKLVAAVADLVVGDPLDPATDIGPVVDEEAAARIGGLVDDALVAGAELACGGRVEGRTVTPTVLTGVRPPARVLVEEVFGPVVAVSAYDELDEAIAAANATPTALQAAVFTHDLHTAFDAAARLRAGGVVVNQSSNFRLDHLPYGGYGESGQGREGPASAVLEMTELKTVLFAGVLG